MIGEAPWCMTCKHYHRKEFGFKCDAFPKGIPKEIVMGFDHRKPFEGDNGIRWEGFRGATDRYTDGVKKKAAKMVKRMKKELEKGL